MAIVNSGHGGTEHVKMMREVCEKFSDDNFKAVFDLYGMATRLPKPKELEFKGNGGHADFREFSFLGAVNPDMVDIDKFGVTEQDRKIGLKQENRDKVDYEKAEKTIEYLVNGSVKLIQEMVEEMNIGGK
jgi:creatinine amidohydrolase/Fe(II)-dependent formamide hydrolase-like protein